VSEVRTVFIPDGYVRLSHAIEALFRRADCTPDGFWIDPKDGPVEKTYDDWSEVFGIKLASAELRAVLIDDQNGLLVPVGPDFWRTAGARDFVKSRKDQLVYYCDDKSYCQIIVVPMAEVWKYFGFNETFGDYYDPPSVWPDAWGPENPFIDRPATPDSAAEVPPERSTKEATSTSSVATAAWMRGYAQGFLDGGKGKVKRDNAIAACRKAMECTYALAEAAYEALPFPDLRNAPRQ
jgi:hypothetical protein